GVFLERQGFKSVPIVSSNIWRYKGYKDLTENFAPDVSHLHAAVACGLAEYGYSGLAITPEYGARQRYVTVVTDAALVPTPLIEPGSVCDMCGLCKKHCMSGALTKEIKGMNVIEIEGNRYTYANKNLWRCSWGEHFDLDLDLPIPEHVDEKVILENVDKYGFRGGEMGSCLRYCVPKERRYFDKSYTNAPRRKRDLQPADGMPVHRGLEERLQTMANTMGIDFSVVTSADDLAGMGIKVTDYLPDGSSAITFGFHYTQDEGEEKLGWIRSNLLLKITYDVARELEKSGYSAVCCTNFPENTLQEQLQGVQANRAVHTATVITSAALHPTSLAIPAPEAEQIENTPDALRQLLTDILIEQEADMVGVAPAERLNALQPQLAAIFDGREYLVSRDCSERFHPYKPSIEKKVMKTLTPEDYLSGAKSVLVIGLRLPQMSVERTALPPAEAVGPYAFAQYESNMLLQMKAFRIMRVLEDLGYRANVTSDLCGTGSVVANPRGEQPDAFCNRFAAVAAGLGRLGKGGFVITPEFGANVRFIAIVTDADITSNPVIADNSFISECASCDRCVGACKTCAFEHEVTVNIDGVAERFYTLDRDHCDWAKRYSLNGDEGVNYVGWNLNIPAPEKITSEALAAAVAQQPTIPKYRPCTFEACVMACPYARSQQ
ncbi:MAG TPA: hypothetical protein VHV83_20030, partial [Armatimonadota bacterium]|nr:hypothetical protein [Armatimonadota bacterium]